MSIQVRAFLVSICVVLISVVGCKKEEQSVTPVASETGETMSGPVNHNADIVACLDGPSRTLYVLPEQRDTVLKLLHASGTAEMYTMESAVNIHNRMVPIGFQVKPVTLNQLINISAWFDLSRAMIDFHNAEAAKDSTRGVFVDTLSRNGVYYRMYKSAECGAVEAGNETDCEAPFYYDLLDSGRSIAPKRGRTERRKFYPISHCLSGKNYCMEALVLRMVTEFYDNDGCNGAPISTVESDHEFSCPLAVPPKTYR